MAQTKSLLDFLSDLATDPVEQLSYNQDPQTYLADHGFADVTGPDIAEAMSLVAETLPPTAAAGVRPLNVAEGDDSLESAIRQLDHLVEASSPSGGAFAADPAAHVDSMSMTGPEPVEESPEGIAGAAATQSTTTATSGDELGGFGEGSTADWATDVDSGPAGNDDGDGDGGPGGVLEGPGYAVGENALAEDVTLGDPAIAVIEGDDLGLPEPDADFELGSDDDLETTMGDGSGNGLGPDPAESDLDAGFF